ncbi:hypothetical protein AB1484_36920 [Parafrankia sp. FMc6]|uniref:hypothetical protein n=1 Tax=Parafrankia soli TaxID=2599596 RepID=UPI0034D3A75A
MIMLIKRLAMTATVAGIMLTSATPAFASTIGVNNSGVAAAADFSWLGQSTIAGAVLYVRDTACDNNDVYAKLTLYTTAGGPVSSGTWINSSGCNTRRVVNLGTLSVAGRLTGVRITACINDFPPDTCVSSGFLDNPNT